MTQHKNHHIKWHDMTPQHTTRHGITWHLATNRITSRHVTPQPTTLLHGTSLYYMTSRASPPPTQRGKAASHWRIVLSLLKLPRPACPALHLLGFGEAFFFETGIARMDPPIQIVWRLCKVLVLTTLRLYEQLKTVAAFWFRMNHSSKCGVYPNLAIHIIVQNLNSKKTAPQYPQRK